MSFGLYARSHLQHSDGSSGGAYDAWDDVGVIKDNDLDSYPEMENTQGTTYSECEPVKLDDCKYDIGQFKSCVKSYYNPSVDAGYQAFFWNCRTFVRHVIKDCKRKSKKN